MEPNELQQLVENIKDSKKKYIIKTRRIKFLIPRILLAEFIGLVLYAKVSGLIAGLILKMTH